MASDADLNVRERTSKKVSAARFYARLLQGYGRSSCRDRKLRAMTQREPLSKLFCSAALSRNRKNALRVLAHKRG